MKGDFSRRTFHKEKHYRGVLMQQGRVQVDADWNEQLAIQQHRDMTAAADVIGLCGAPENEAGFEISITEKNLLAIGPGRYYVDGILGENEKQVSYEKQPDLIEPPALLKEIFTKPGTLGLVYLDVWPRHITRLEDPLLHEKALGEPDTATRAKTVWQVRVAPIKHEIAHPETFAVLLSKRNNLQDQIKLSDSSDNLKEYLGALVKLDLAIAKALGELSCSQIPEWDRLIAPSTGTLNARTQTVSDPQNPCLIPAGAGYQRLENQLYRVEIHEGGTFEGAGKTTVSFKWSRENGSIVTAWEDQSGPNLEFLTVTNPGRDSVLGFAAGQWVELTDDKLELDGAPGTLVQLKHVDGKTLTIDPATAKGTIKRSDFSHNPKVRRWDSLGAVAPNAYSTSDKWLELEAGVQVQFSPGTYHSGDYWLIPARTAGAEIEWPPFKIPNTNPVPQPPLGIRHHYCPLALIFLGQDKKFYVVSDCRHIFPPLTGLVDFYYVGGDGQEAMPDLTQPQNLVALAVPLQVGVANWRWPVAGATVLFEIFGTNGRLEGIGPSTPPGSAVKVLTGSDGIAGCNWQLDPTTQDQQVQATLLDEQGRPMQTPIRFHANLSVAEQVAYNPGTCGALQGQKNVQAAIDRLAQLVSLYYVSGDGQEGLPGGKLQPLVVQVSNPCGPVQGDKIVHFEIKAGTGLLNGQDKPLDLPTDKDGFASCDWTLDNSTGHQQVEATLLAEPATPPTKVLFNANLSLASQVAYVPSDQCSELAKVRNVQAALDLLCQRPAGAGCSVAVPPGEDLGQVIKKLLDQGRRDLCLCLMPGNHVLESLTLDKGVSNLKITGCGGGTRLLAKGPWQFTGLGSFTLREVQLQAADLSQGLMTFKYCGLVTLEACNFSQTGLRPNGSLCSIYEAGQIYLARNVFEAGLAVGKVPPADIVKGVDDGLAKLFKLGTRREYALQAGKIAGTLAATKVEERRVLVQKLNKAVSDARNDLSEMELASYNGLTAALAATSVDPSDLTETMNALFDAANQRAFGLALILGSPEADTYLVENRMAGEVSLYGAPAEEKLTGSMIEETGKDLRPVLEKLGSPPAKGTLHLRDNQFTAVTAGEKNFRILVQQGVLGQVYRAAFLTNNWFETRTRPYTAVVADRLTLAGNSFAGPYKTNYAGLMVARSATYTGNQGLEPQIIMYDLSLSKDTNKAANDGIEIKKCWTP